jgi:competence protein ComEC
VLLDAIHERGQMATAAIVGEPCRGRVRLRWQAATLARGGDRVVVVGSWRRTLLVKHARVLAGSRSRRGAIRGRVEERLARLMGGRRGMAEALVLARAGAVPSARREEFVRAGLAHLLAISGLHVGFLAWWVSWGARRLGVRGNPSRTAGAVVAFGYAWLLGFPAPATRASWFLLIGAAARVRQRRPAPGAVLAVAALGVLAVDPSAIHSIGAWLSLSAVAGVSWARRHLSLPAALSSTVGATLFTAPITAGIFGTVAPAGLAANLVAVPLAALAVPGLLLAILADGLLPAIGAIFAAGAGVALAAIEAVARAAGRLPYGHVVTVAGWTAAVPWFALLAASVWSRWRRPTLGVTLRRLALPAALASWTWMAAGVVRRDDGATLAVHFLAVGQGDAAAIRTPRGRWMLIDGGPRGASGDAGRRVVVPFLRRRGVTDLAAIMLSHGHADHLGGLIAVLDALDVEHVWEPGQPIGDRLYLDFLAAVEADGAEWHAARRGDRVELDSVVFVVHHPDSAWLATSLDVNENSLVVELRYREFRAIFAGDAGYPAEWYRGPSLEPVDVLKVGHHGSSGATSDAWLRQLGPRAAVISVGASNRYGHPAPDALARLARRGIAVYRTDRDGPVVVRSDGFTFSVGTKHGDARYVGHHNRAVHHGSGAAPPGGHRGALQPALRYRPGGEDHLAAGAPGGTRGHPRQRGSDQHPGRDAAEARRLRQRHPEERCGARRSGVRHGLGGR